MNVTEFPSDFDPYSLLSDYPPQSDDIHPPSPQTDQHESTFSDELEGIREVAQERVNRLTKDRVVIQHRQWGGEPIFRSSSLPPASPTPAARPLKSKTSYVQQEPSGIVSQNSTYDSAFTSSPPPMEDTHPHASDESLSSPEDSTVTDSRNPVDPPAPFKPDFGSSLSGGLFSKRFARPTKPKQVADDAPDVPIPSSETMFTAASSTASIFVPAPQAKEAEDVAIVTNRGTTIRVRRRQKGASTLDNTETSPVATKTFFGVDIHGIIDKNKCAQAHQALLQGAEQSVPHPVTGNTGKSKKKLLWSEKYRAKRFTDLVGDERTHRHVMHWLKGWDPIVFPSQSKAVQKKSPLEEEPEKAKILLLHGPPGLGKTTLAHVAARQAGYEPVEINASDDRSKNIVEGKIKDLLTIEGVKSSGIKSGKTQTVSARPLCLIIDEIDGVGGGGGGGGGETGFIKSLIDLIMADQRSANRKENTTRKGKKKETFKMNRPIIAVCNDLYAPVLKPLRALAEVVQMRVPPKGSLEDRLEWIFNKEGYATEDGAVRKMVELSAIGSGNGRGGDMRNAMVNAEWISARLRQSRNGIPDKVNNGRQLLTRKIVEDELGGPGVGKNDGKGSGGRSSIRDAVESVFRIEKESLKSKTSSDSTTSATKVRELVDALGEFDKIALDCFTTYPKRQFHDDFCLTKPNTAYEWLWFHDLLSSRAFSEQNHGLYVYLSQPMVAFHQLFATATSNQESPQENSDGPFNGPGADWESREFEKENQAMAQRIHSSLASIRLGQTFKSQALITTELAPYTNLMLSPRVNPVVVGGGSGFGVASVRRESEKKLVNHAVIAMEATGVYFEKMRVELTPGEFASTGWAYRMVPPLDQLGVYPTFVEKDNAPVKYATRQVLDQEWRKSLILKDKASREARMGPYNATASDAPALAIGDIVLEGQKRTRAGAQVKKDFFGRIVAQETDGGGENGPKKKRKTAANKHPEVWVSFNEGFSNAVRKGIRLSELVDGLS